MGQEIFADLYFLINSGMDLLCLMLSATLLHRRVHPKRALLAAALGGLYALLSLLWGWSGPLGFLGDCGAALLICAVAFGQGFGRRGKEGTDRLALLRISGVFVLVSMILGGVMTALYSLLNRLDLPFELLSGDGLSVWTFVVVSAVGALITARGGRLFGRSQRNLSLTLQVTLYQKTLTLCALVDTGNLLRDPISGKSVIVADLKALSTALPKELLEACQRGDALGYLSTCQSVRGLRLITAKSVAEEKLLLALTPDRLTISDGRETYEADYLIAPAPLDSRAQGFDAIIGSD